MDNHINTSVPEEVNLANSDCIKSKMDKELKFPEEDDASDEEVPPIFKSRRAENLVPLPPDGGYGWVIVIACFICNGIVEGSVGSFGIFLPYFAEAFNASRAKTTIAGSLLIGGFLILGAIVSGLINCFGCRVVTITGSVLTVLAFTACTLAPSIDSFIVLYGFIGGFGLAMIYLPAMVMVGYYFERRRSLATGIAYSGAGIGMLVMAPVSAALVSAYDWRNALILLATFPLQGIVLGALMRPLQIPNPKFDEFCEPELDKDDKALDESASPLYYKGGQLIPATDMKFITNRIMGKNIRFSSVSTTTIGSENIKTQSMFILPPQLREQEQPEKFKPPSKNNVMVTQSCVDLPSDPLSRKRTFYSYKIQNRNRKVQERSSFISCQQLSNLPDDFLRQIDMRKLREEISKPLARRDVFYSGSIHYLQEYQNQPDLQSYIASVTMIPKEDMQKPVSSLCPWLSKSTLSTLIEMMQCNILFHPHFLIICLASVFIQLGYFIPVVFISNYAITCGVSERWAAILISVIGLANTFGRTTAGALGNLPSVNTLHLNNICLILVGGATLLACVVCKTYPLLVIYAFIFGLLTGAFVPLTTIFIVKYLGLHRLNNAMGLLSLVRGLSSMAGPPIAGALLDSYQSFAPVFYFAGSMFITAGCVFYLISFLSPNTDASTETSESNLSPDGESAQYEEKQLPVQV